MEVSATPSGVRRFLRPKIVVSAAVVAAALAAAVLIWFQPQKLFLNTTVDEGMPGVMKKDDAMAKDSAMKKDEMVKEGAMMMSSGAFRGIAHDTSGKAVLEKAEDGHYYVRLQEFKTTNGPDLFVYLSAAPASSSGADFTKSFLDLGPLKGNIGNQNYLVPDGTDLSKYQSVVIWCRRFTTAFGAAGLEPLNSSK